MLCARFVVQAVGAAVQAAVADADAAVAAGQSFAAMQVDVGLDPKALLEAWNAIQKQHPSLPVIMFSLDQGALPVPHLPSSPLPVCHSEQGLDLLRLVLSAFLVSTCAGCPGGLRYHSWYLRP